MDERDDEPVRHETTVINTGGDREGGSGVAIVAVLVILLVGIGAFLYFGGWLGGTRNNPDINLNIKAPDIDIKAPNININPPSTAPAPSNPPPANTQ